MTPTRFRRFALSALAAAATACQPPAESLLSGAATGDAWVRELLSVVGNRRLLEARLVGDADHAPCPGSSLSEHPGSCSDLPLALNAGSDGFVRLAEAIRPALRNAPSPALSRARAWLQLVTLRSAEDLDRVAAFFEDAVRAAPEDPRLLSDLAAVRYVRGRWQHRASELVRALETVDRALAADGGLEEALFNRALILDALTLRQEAERAWQSFLRLDPSPGWAREARERLEELVERRESLPDATEALRNASDPEQVIRLATEYPQEARLLAEQELLTSWAASWSEGDAARSRRALDAVRAVGGALERRHGDRLLSRAAGVIEQALAESELKRLENLATGHLAFDRGRGSVLHRGCAEPGSPLREARELLERARSPFVHRADVELSICHFYGRDYSRALGVLIALRDRIDGEPYTTLRGRVDWMTGLVLMIQGDLASSLERYESAVRAFEHAGEAGHAAYLHSLIAKDLRHLGAQEESWNHRLLALRGRHRITEPDRHFTIFQEAADALALPRPRRQALYFLDEKVKAGLRGLEVGEPDLAPLALLERGRVRQALGDARGALEDLEQARHLLDLMPDDYQLTRLVDVYLEIARAHTEAEENPHQLVATLSDALAFFSGAADTLDNQLRILRTYRDRAQARLQLGDVEAAEADLESGIEEAERQRSRLDDPRLRASYFHQVTDLFEEMIALQVDVHGRPDIALGWAERARNRTLLDLSTGADSRPSPKPWDHGQISRATPPGTALIYYALLPERILTWVSHDGVTRFSERRLARDRLRERTKRFRNALERGAPGEEIREVATDLHEILVPEAARSLPAETTLVFIPEAPLHEVPFAALVNPSTGRYLIEDHPIVVSPSATLFLRRLGGRPLAGPGEASVLIVGDPAFDQRSYPRLARLPAAAREARRLAGELYPSATLLVGSEATRRRFLDALPHHELIHFAGHALAETGSSRRPGLLFAPEPGDEPGHGSLLEADELLSYSPQRTRLVVLAACSTALGQQANSHEIAGLAAVFLARGVTSVVASLWAVEDRASSEFLYEFHVELGRGSLPVEALRLVQLRRVRDSPKGMKASFTWAAFVLFGHGSSIS